MARHSPFSWAGKKVLITGGSSGIGKHVAAHLLRMGASVGIVAHDKARLEAAAAELRQVSPKVWSHPCDVASLPEIRAMTAACRERFGVPDVIVNNAGYAVYYAFEQMPSEEIQRLLDVNLRGAALVTRELLPDLIAAGGGDIVMVASIAGRVPMTPCGVYSASKHGMVSLAQLLHIELARFNVRIHVVCPGRVETDFFAHESFRQRAHRPESNRTVPIEMVSQAIVDSVVRNRSMTYVPRHYGLLVWLVSAMPFVFRPLWRRLMTSRVDALYEGPPTAADAR
jgi:short-subunit dehydrogenase